MDEPQAPAVEQDSPTTQDAPQAPDGYVPVSELEALRKQAADHQAWGTKNAQAAAQLERLESDEAARIEWIRSQGFEVEEPDPGYQDPNTAYEKRLERIEQEFEARQQQEQQREQIRVLETSINEQFKAIPDLNDEDREWVEDRAVTRLAPREDGMPDIHAAYQQLVERDLLKQKTWAQTKKRAPAITPGGQPGSKVPDLSNENERLAWMAQRLDDLNAT